MDSAPRRSRRLKSASLVEGQQVAYIGTCLIDETSPLSSATPKRRVVVDSPPNPKLFSVMTSLWNC